MCGGENVRIKRVVSKPFDNHVEEKITREYLSGILRCILKDNSNIYFYNFIVKKGIIKMVGGNFKGLKADVERILKECDDILELRIVICPIKSDDALVNKNRHIKERRDQNNNVLGRCMQLKFEVDKLVSKYPKDFNELTDTRETWEGRYRNLIATQKALKKRIEALENCREMMDSGIKKEKH